MSKFKISFVCLFAAFLFAGEALAQLGQAPKRWRPAFKLDEVELPPELKKEKEELERKRAEQERLQVQQTTFTFQDQASEFNRNVMTVPGDLGQTFTTDQIHGPLQLPSYGPKDEYLIDGHDRDARVYVNENWEVFGLETEDTIGHFDTLDGRRIATPSNRVAIYAPRFSSVRRVAGVTGGTHTNKIATTYDRMAPVTRGANDFTSTTLQNIQANAHKSADLPLAFIDETRGVLLDSVKRLGGLSSGYKAYENLRFMKFGTFESSESTRLSVGLIGAQAWTDSLRVLINDAVRPTTIIKDVAGAQDITLSETEGENPVLRVAKVASRITAKPGDVVEFTLRYDNVGNERIGNVTIIDSLTTRLEYVEGSAECSMEADFSASQNEGESLTLRWEVIEPLDIGKGGVIRFKCRVR